MSQQFNISEIKADLEQYLNTNDINAVFVDMVENLLLSKPENPQDIVVRYFLERFTEETRDMRLQLSAGPRRQSISRINESEISNDAKGNESEEESDTDSDEEPEEEMAKPRLFRRRQSVCSERLDSLKCDISVITKNPKSEDECKAITKVLQNNILFKHLDEEQLRPIHSAMSLITKKKGDIIIKQGDDGDDFYAVKDGTVDIFKHNDKEDKVECDEVMIKSNNVESESFEENYGKFVKQCTVGDCFGELAILYNAPRAATCIASSDVELWALDRVSLKLILMSTAIAKSNMIVNFLERVHILSQSTQKEIYTIAESMQEESFEKNDIIFNEGDSGRKFYIIKEGIANCVGLGKVVARLESGAYFGEIALLTTKPRQATVVVVSETLECLTLDRKTFDRVMGPLKKILMRNLEEYNKIQATII